MNHKRLATMPKENPMVDVQATKHEDKCKSDPFPLGCVQSPYHAKRESQNKGIRDNVRYRIGDIEMLRIDTLGSSLVRPKSSNRVAGEYGNEDCCNEPGCDYTRNHLGSKFESSCWEQSCIKK